MSDYQRVGSLRELYEFCELTEPTQDVVTGRIARTGTFQHPYSKNGAVMTNSDGSVVAWNFENPSLKAYYLPQKESSITGEQKKAIQESIKKAKDQLANQQLIQYQTTAKRAYAFYRKLDGCYANKHPYLKLKGVKHTGAMRVTTSAQISQFFKHKMELKDPVLVIPLTDGTRIQSLQFIGADGQKRFLSQGRKKGCYWLSQWKGVEPLRVSIAEGVATALSVKEYLESIDPKTPQIVIAAMDCGNLLAAAKAAKKAYPEAEICFFADNDRNRAGISAAIEAVTKLDCQAKIYYPEFSTLETDIFKEKNHDVQKMPSDFNDKAMIGLEKLFDLEHPFLQCGNDLRQLSAKNQKSLNMSISSLKDKTQSLQETRSEIQSIYRHSNKLNTTEALRTLTKSSQVSKKGMEI